MRKSIKQEIAELLKTREKFRAEEFKMRMNRNNTRARVTTMNAKIGQVNDMIHDLREMEKLEK
tara:strand:- start:264 stop:452 length:189 start_codon:yes stop_codon:yes gene_type:complete